jgi:hypothetical protein
VLIVSYIPKSAMFLQCTITVSYVANPFIFSYMRNVLLIYATVFY